MVHSSWFEYSWLGCIQPSEIKYLSSQIQLCPVLCVLHSLVNMQALIFFKLLGLGIFCFWWVGTELIPSGFQSLPTFSLFVEIFTLGISTKGIGVNRALWGVCVGGMMEGIQQLRPYFYQCLFFFSCPTRSVSIHIRLNLTGSHGILYM